MRTYAVYLRPKGSFHSQIYSDTLFGAVCWAIHELRLGDLDQMLPSFNDAPLFIFTSAFPYLQVGQSKVRFFPKPLLPELSSEQVNQEAERVAKEKHVGFKSAKMKVVERAKVWKEARYVSENLFWEIMLGQANTETLHRRLVEVGLKEEDVEKIGQVLMTTGERRLIEPDRRLSSFSLDADIQRNQTDRVAGATVEGLLFLDTQTFLHREIAGLWFLVRTRDLDFLRPAFRYLADTGIGGRRSVGKGHFDIEIDEREHELPDAENEANSFVVLSRYLPKAGECDFEGSPLSYVLMNLRSKHEFRHVAPEQPIYKEMVRVLAEGSILPFKERRGFYGRIEEVAKLEGRRVWQNGLALPVFAHIKKEDGNG